MFSLLLPRLLGVNENDTNARSLSAAWNDGNQQEVGT